MEKAGYRPITRNVTVEAGKQTPVSLSLPLLAGTLTVRTQPGGAEVLLNGKSVGRTPITRRWSIGALEHWGIGSHAPWLVPSAWMGVNKPTSSRAR